MNRSEIEQKLIEKSEQDPAFRRRLLAQPRETLEKEFGIAVPASVNLQVIEETANSLMLVLPAAAGELSDLELEAVAGGKEGDPFVQRSATLN